MPSRGVRRPVPRPHADPLRRGAFLALQQAAYDSTKRIALDAGAEPSVPLFLGCSMTAGALAQTCVYPLDLIRRRIQMGATATAAASATVVADATWLAGLRHVIANEGFKGAFAGIVPTYAKVIPSVMITKPSRTPSFPTATRTDGEVERTRRRRRKETSKSTHHRRSKTRDKKKKKGTPKKKKAPQNTYITTKKKKKNAR